MWSLSAWRRRRLLAKHPIADDTWQRVRHHLSFLDGISAEQDQWLREACVVFLAEKHLTALPGVELHQEQRLLLAAQAQLPLMNLGDLELVRGLPRNRAVPRRLHQPSTPSRQPAASNTSGTASTVVKPGNTAR